MADTSSDATLANERRPSAEMEDTFEDAQDTATSKAVATGEHDQLTNGHTDPEKNAGEHDRSNGTSVEESGQHGVQTVNGDGRPPSHSRQSTNESMIGHQGRSVHVRDRSISPIKSSPRRRSPVKALHGFTGGLPTVNSPPPPSTSERLHAIEARNLSERRNSATLAPQQANMARKASSGFAGLLGRMGSIRRPARSPPAPKPEGRFTGERRNTAASLASIDSTPTGLVTITDGRESAEVGRPSLQDQFQSLRRQEEQAGNGVEEEAGHDPERTPIARTVSEAVVSIPTVEKKNGENRLSRAYSTPGLLKSPPLNPSLPPGTASGLLAGPAEEPRPVNWDLWQHVVNDGPAAVARTSGEELNLAIASGIPPAIRGVVWQVLADSKNEELETIYHTLKARGTDVETVRPPPALRSESQSLTNGSSLGKESTASSHSSIHSGTSTPATSNRPSSPPSVDAISSTDLHSKLLAEKQKREAAALSKLEKAIKRDLGSRTSYSKFTQSAGLQDGLFGVCKAYALFDEGVGYAQGINFVAMPLLFNMSEEEAFTLLVRLMSKYDLRSMFVPEMAGLHLRLYQFERLLEESDAALYCHLKRRSVGPQLYATQWFLTLFAYRFPLQLVLRVYDLIFTEGLSAILKFGLVLMQRNREALLQMKDMGQLTNFLKEKLFDAYIDKTPSASSLLDSGFFGSVTGGADKELYRADELVRDACAVSISDSTLAAYTAEWEESQRAERERSDELDLLRSTNTQHASRIKSLEDRAQKQDAEHVALASELVKVKVDNEGLADQNEGLKMQVAELQRMVDLQPGEVEARLKEEMDRIMQRNIEVQNENRALSQEMQELEGELVRVKMTHAQTQSDHDALKQRWANVYALFKED